jgi:hypothetical protein
MHYWLPYPVKAVFVPRRTQAANSVSTLILRSPNTSHHGPCCSCSLGSAIFPVGNSLYASVGAAATLGRRVLDQPLIPMGVGSGG